MVKPQRDTRPGTLTKGRWQQKCLLCTEQPHLGSWLFFKDGGVGCKACHLNGSQDEFGRCVARIRVERFESHNQTQSHKDNVAALLKCPHCVKLAGELRAERSAPTKAAFLKVLQNRSQGGAIKAISGIGHRKKITQMQFCLAEGLRSLDREHIRKSDSIVFHADGRKHRFTGKFSAGRLDTLSVRRGVLGHSDFVKVKADQPDAASAYAEALQQTMTNFCTTGHGAPYLAKGDPQPIFDRSLFERIRNTHEVFDADGDPTTQAAGEMVTDAFHDNPNSLLPRTKLLLKDATHAARRTPGGEKSDPTPSA